MNIYLSNTTNFSNNGLGFLTDIISANVIDELNGNYQLQLVYIRDGKLSEYLVEENIIKCKVSDSTYQLFRITNVEKTFKTITIIAKHIFYDLLNNFLENTYPQNLSCQLFLQHILDHTNFSNNFTAVSDISTTKTARYVRMNPVSAIIGDNNNSMVNLFGGELKRDNFTINFLSRVGSNNGVKLLIGKNITGINISIDITSMATRIMPQGFDGLLLPELYVDSPLINNYPTPKIVKIEFSDVVYDPDVENAYHDIQDAYAELRRRAEEQYSLGIDKPKINIKIDWIELSKTEEYKSYQNLERVNLGDTITAYILGINYETRVISTNYDVLKDMIVDFEIGTVKPSITSSMSKIQKSVEEINPDSILKTAKDEATELITTAMGGYVYKTESELYIMNTNDPTTATKVWRWNINGLGYSSTGINGPYGIAMTMDGAIVADYITTGTLNTSVIQGYDSIVTTVSGISTTYETKTDATSKLNTAKTYADGVSSTAETNAKNYTDSELDNITNTIDETTTSKSFYIENAQNEKPIEMELYGDTLQDGTPTPDSPVPIEVVTGRQEINVVGKNILKNTLDILKTNNQSGTWNDNVYTYNGITFTYNNDGSITANGTTTNNISRLYISRTGNFEYTTLLAGTYYITSNETTGSNSTWKMQYGIDGKTYNVFGNGSSKEATVNLTNNSDVNGYIYIYANQTINNITFYPMISTKSNIEYEPYNGKSYEINLGKNLLDVSDITNKTGITRNGNTITLSGTPASASWSLTKPFVLKANQTYTMSITNRINETNINNATFILRNGSTNIISIYYNDSNKQIQYTPTQDVIIDTLRIYTGGYTFNNYSFSVQLEKGTQATTYSPYKEPIELCEINDYQDKIFKRDNRWYLYKAIGKVTFDGSENGSFISSNNNGYLFQIYSPTIPLDNYSTNYINTHSLSNSTANSTNANVGSYIYNNTYRIRVSSTIATTYSQLQSWLETANNTIYFPLVTPITEEISDIELIEQLNAFELMTGINNITNNSNDLVADMYLKYYLHTPISDTYVNKVELNSQLKITSESISSEVNATYETKTDATSKLGEAKGYTDNQLTSYSTTTQMNSAITQKADEITQSVSQTYTTLDVTGGLSERVEAAEGNLTTQGAKLNIISKNIDSTTGDIKSVKTLKGFTLDDEGFKIATSESDFNSLSNETGTYYKDGDTILTQFTKDNSITKDLVLYGTYYYGVDKDLDVSNFTKDDAMFVAEKYTDNNNEVGFGHFYNGGD